MISSFKSTSNNLFLSQFIEISSNVFGIVLWIICDFLKIDELIMWIESIR